MSKSDSLNHAIHNKEVCVHLSKESRYSDWVITTAFYSAVHFVEHKIFPIKGFKSKRIEYDFTSFNGYYDFYSNNKVGKINQHNTKQGQI